ncbi:MAG: hypothetical protein EPN82_13035 [Bacteroidetes bacterium]|nr:MAG: hypothetical protein EPN82_13035 [Bacteroidota bacterium]
MSTENNENIPFKLTWKINTIGIWLILIMIIQIVIAYFTYRNFIEDGLKNIILISLSGGLGGTIYCLRGFYQQIGKKEFNTYWFWWYIIRPIASIVMGAFSYFLVAGGLLIISTSPDLSQDKGLMFFCSLAFIVGISFTRFMDKIYQVAEVMFSPKN